MLECVNVLVMKIKLTLTRDQYKGLATIAQNCCSAIGGETFHEVQYRDALRGLTLRMAAKVPTLKAKRNVVTLGELESLALFSTVDDLVPQFQPYEMSIGYWLLGEIDRQRGQYVTLMKANLSALDGFNGRNVLNGRNR